MPTSSDLYLRDISRFEVLSEDEKLKLIWAVKRHNRKAIDRLITSNLRFVISVAKKYRGKGLTFQELISEGNAGLIQACKKFKVEKKVKFISYAVWWIRQSIQAAPYNQVGTIRIPPNRVVEINKFKKELNNNDGNYNKTLDFKEFKNNKVDIIENINKMYGVSLDSPVDGKEDTLVFSDILGTEPEQYMDGDKSELRAVLDSVLQTIPHLEEKVIRLYFGLDFLTSMTLEEIAKELELHREVVRHMKEKALRRLMGNPLIKEKLEIFIKS